MWGCTPYLFQQKHEGGEVQKEKDEWFCVSCIVEKKYQWKKEKVTQTPINLHLCSQYIIKNN